MRYLYVGTDVPCAVVYAWLNFMSACMWLFGQRGEGKGLGQQGIVVDTLLYDGRFRCVANGREVWSEEMLVRVYATLPQPCRSIRADSLGGERQTGECDPSIHNQLLSRTTPLGSSELTQVLKSTKTVDQINTKRQGNERKNASSEATSHPPIKILVLVYLLLSPHPHPFPPLHHPPLQIPFPLPENTFKHSLLYVDSGRRRVVDLMLGGSGGIGGVGVGDVGGDKEN